MNSSVRYGFVYGTMLVYHVAKMDYLLIVPLFFMQKNGMAEFLGLATVQGGLYVTSKEFNDYSFERQSGAFR